MQDHDHEDNEIKYNIIGNESNWYKRGIRESIEIRKRKPTLNADEGRYHLSQIWTKILKRQSENTLQRTQQNDPTIVSNEHLLMTT